LLVAEEPEKVLGVAELEVIEPLVLDLHLYKDAQLLCALHQVLQLQLEPEVETLAVQLILHHVLVRQTDLELVMETCHRLNQDVQLLFKHQVVVIH
tara:strand:+ start:22 stop:309 length:288 start_codon:yes stop_codon:yes gene_type:complete